MTETYQLKHTGEQIDALLDKAGTAVQPTDIPADIATQRELSDLAQTTDERLSDLAQTTDAKLTELSAEVDELSDGIISENLDDAFVNVGYVHPSGSIDTTAAGFHYTDAIDLDGVKRVHTENLQYNNQYIAVIAFYAANGELIKAVSNVGTAAMTSYDIDVPEGAKYMRCTSRDIFPNPKLQIVYSESRIFLIADEVERLSDDMISLNQAALRTATQPIIYGADDSDWYKSYYVAFGIGQFYQGESLDINAVRLNGLKLRDNSEIEYRVYITTYSKLNAVITESSHRLIKSGKINKQGEGYIDYVIQFDDFIHVDEGECIVAYAKGNSQIEAKVGTPVGSEKENKLLFSLTTAWDGLWYFGSGDTYYAQHLSPIIMPTFIKLSSVNEQEEEEKADIVIPPIVYAMEGIELNIWNDTISMSVDGGLMSPLNYKVRWNCAKGTITERGFRFTPSASDVGNVQCTCYLYDIKGGLVASKTFTIKVVSASALKTAKKIAYFGDSLGYGVATELYRTFNSEAFKGTAPTMVGTKGTTYKYEAVGGYKWANYATKGDDCYRTDVSGVTSLAKGARYIDANNRAFEIAEINTTNGNGNILLYKFYTDGQYGYGDLQTPNGTLTKISGAGDDRILYSGAFKESTNPLWNASLNNLDVGKFKTACGLTSSDKIDAVSFQFGINDDEMADDLTTLRSYITALYNAFMADNPSCKFIVGLTTTSGNTVDGCGANYGASFDWKVYQDRVYRIRKAYIELLKDASLPNLRIASPHLFLDRYYGYALSTRAVSARCDVQEQYHNNYVHPAASGYAQMADAYIGAFIDALIA